MLRTEEVTIVGRNHELRGGAAQANQAKEGLDALPQAKRIGQVGDTRLHNLLAQGFQAVAVAVDGIISRQQDAALGIENEEQAIEQHQRLLVEQGQVVEGGSRLLAFISHALTCRVDGRVHYFARAIDQRSHQRFERTKDAALERRTDALGMFAATLVNDIEQAASPLIRLERLGAEECPEGIKIAVAAIFKERFQVNLEILLATGDDVAFEQAQSPPVAEQPPLSRASREQALHEPVRHIATPPG